MNKENKLLLNSEKGILNSIMKNIVDKEVINYKTDLELDYDIIKSVLKNTKKETSFIWFTRESGTVIMQEDFIKVIKSNANIQFEYWYKSVTNCYRIKVSKACKNIYGEIEKINLKKYYEEVMKNKRKCEKIQAKIETKEGKFIEGNYDFTEDYFQKAIYKEKIDIENVKSFSILNYN